MVIGLYPCRGSAIARIVGVNVQEHKEFHTAVKMWVFEEMVDGRKLTEIINEQHENTKYLPGFKIPENVVRTYMYIRNVLSLRNKARAAL